MQKTDFSELIKRWPAPYVARTNEHLVKFGGGMLPDARAMANFDSKGKGPEGRVRIGRKVAYPVVNLVKWLEARAMYCETSQKPVTRRGTGMNDYFQQINQAVLAKYPYILDQWLPEGRIQGKEYVACHPRRTDEHPGSFSVNTRTGVWKCCSRLGLKHGKVRGNQKRGIILDAHSLPQLKELVNNARNVLTAPSV